MPLADILQEFRDKVVQCDSLIANCHRNDALGAALLPATDQQQITVAALLNLFIAWESFLEASIVDIMAGGVTINGTAPTKYVAPPHTDAARDMIVGVLRYFDYANHDNVKRIVNIYFQNGEPFEPHLSGIFSDLADLRTMRNASAHITVSTQQSLEALALRIFGAPRPGITLYQLMTAADPRMTAGGTVFATYRDSLLATAELIARG
jgi:hypothetical protein